MLEATITVKNYRCFDDENPLVIKFGNGFVALVGQNNGGKSSFLKLFYELRNVWAQTRQQLQTLLHGKDFGIPTIGVHDESEIFFDGNNRAIQIQFDLTDSSEPQSHISLTKAILYCDRNKPTTWRASFYCGPDQKHIGSVPEFAGQKCHAIPNDMAVYGGNIHLDCRSFLQLIDALSNSLYVGPFRNAINEGSGNYYDLAIGSSFIDTWHYWKTGNLKAQNSAIAKVTDQIKHIFEFESLEISAAQSAKTLQVNIDGKPYKLGELGAGLSQFIIVLANAMIRKPSLILIDEPELNLHPALQIDFLTSLASYASCGVVFATHSLGLARSTAERIYSFQKKNGKTLVREFNRVPNYAEFIGEMSFASFQELGYERILLVEGVSDVKTIQQFLRKLNKDHKIVIIPLGGDQLARGGVEQELAELQRLSNKISVLVDSEQKSEEDQPETRRKVFADACMKLGFDILVTQRRAIENYLSDTAIKNIKGDKYSALEPYQSLNDSTLPWDKSENWRIAQEMKFEEIKDTDLGKFLVGL